MLVGAFRSIVGAPSAAFFCGEINRSRSGRLRPRLFLRRIPSTVMRQKASSSDNANLSARKLALFLFPPQMTFPDRRI
jgi:hypothetical protein